VIQIFWTNHVEQPILGFSQYLSLLASSLVVFLQGEMAWKGRVSHLRLFKITRYNLHVNFFKGIPACFLAVRNSFYFSIYIMQ